MEKRTKAPQKETIETVVNTYKRTGSINDTALQTEMSTTKVRKILITEGLWESDRSREIRTLSDAGKSSQEIAEELHISRAMVQNYLPYEKGLYDEEEKSETAIRSEKYRERNRAYIKKSQEREQQRVDGLTTGAEAAPSDGKKCSYAMQLRLELRDSRLHSMYDKDEAKILAKYGRVTTSISRDVIVPSSLALHQLHYLINMAFGWTNSHLHDSQLPKPLFDMLTEGKLLEIAAVFGYYLKFPSSTFNDEFWDDDYDESKSPRSWMRSKYLKRYRYLGHSDYWIDNQAEILTWARRMPVLEVDPLYWGEEGESRSVKFEDVSVQELLSAISFDSGMPYVLKESLRLSEILSLNPVEIEIAKNTAVQSDSNDVLRYSSYRDAAFAEISKEENDRDLLAYYRAFAEMVRLRTETEPEHVMPITSTLLYSYDYGDGWEVDISLVKEFGKDRREVDDEAAANVIATGKPICIAKDGLNVVDDCGHVSGYVDMLQTIHEGDRDDAHWMKEWARSQGWTGRNMNPKHMI
jgi:predicted transcriptional regulator